MQVEKELVSKALQTVGAHVQVHDLVKAKDEHKISNAAYRSVAAVLQQAVSAAGFSMQGSLLPSGDVVEGFAKEINKHADFLSPEPMPSTRHDSKGWHVSPTALLKVMCMISGHRNKLEDSDRDTIYPLCTLDGTPFAGMRLGHWVLQPVYKDSCLTLRNNCAKQNGLRAGYLLQLLVLSLLSFVILAGQKGVIFCRVEDLTTLFTTSAIPDSIKSEKNCYLMAACYGSKESTEVSIHSEGLPEWMCFAGQRLCAHMLPACAFA